MSVTGQVKNGVVVLDAGTLLPEGTRVRVELVEEADEPTLADRLRPVIGIVEGLPSDLAQNHDHYLHGRPKK
jgi:hypothetical protein